MSLLLLAPAVTLIVLLSSFITDLNAFATRRVAAQSAADAGALAAVAASTIGGSGRPAEDAARFASLNDAALVRCRCAPGSTVAAVVVVREGVEARAQAVLDPALLRPASSTAATTGLHPVLAAAIDRMVAASGGRIEVTSALRSFAEQSRLWNDALRRYGTPEAADDWVARPGTSMHERGLAVDLSGDLNLAAALVRDMGLPLHRPLAHEPWHFELIVPH